MPGLLVASLGIGLVGIGFLCILLRRSLLWKLLGLNVSSGGGILVLVALSYRPDVVPPLLIYPRGVPMADPLPQALVLTAIVIHFATLALALAYAIHLTERLHTQEADRLEERVGEEEGP